MVQWSYTKGKETEIMERKYRIYVTNLSHQNGIVQCSGLWKAEREFAECRSIDGGSAHLQGYCPLIGWANLKTKVGE